MATAGAATFFALVAGGYMALGVAGVRHALRRSLGLLAPVAQLLAGPVLLLIAVVAYAWASRLPVAARLGTYGAYLLVPPLLLAFPGRGRGRSARVPVAELLVALALWLPLEFRLLAPLPVPAPDGYDLRKLVGLVSGMYLFLVARPLPRIGYTYRLTGHDAAKAVVAFLVYACVALPIGFATGFIAWRPELNVARVLGAPIVIYLVTAVPEEFLFRGLIQNLLARWLGVRAGLPIAAVIFGLAHLPDLRYVLLAALAGLAYGWVYERTEKITASAITHALVDAAWGALLGG